jgi:ribose transport system ATP-binding protein
MKPPLLRLRGIAKSFSGVPVLRGVSLSLDAGEALGIAGANGAGKSTLMNILGGVLRADSGEMLLDDRVFAPQDAAAASAAGVEFVHQELNLFPNLSIAENLFLTALPKRRWMGLPLLDYRRAAEQTRELLRVVDLPLEPETLVERLSPGERQLVEIAKVLHHAARVVIFDEPTTSLTAQESSRLFAIIERLRSAGAGILFISHALEQVLRLCPRILVLRDGEVAACGPAAEFSERRMISLMVGRAVERLYPARRPFIDGEAALEARGLSHPGILEDVTFTLHRGEILGISGLIGSGRSELARILFGLDRCDRGEVLLGNRPLDGLPAFERVRRGLAFVTESRREDGLLMDAPVDANLSLVAQRKDRVASVAAQVQLHCANLHSQPVRQLSGGNQQKVVLGKWLAADPRVFILDEPTRGIDAGARPEIYRIVASLASSGAAVLLISSEIEELMGMCDRILVMRRGEIRASVPRAAFDRERLLEAAL